MTANRVIDEYTDAEAVSAVATADNYVKRDGSKILTSDWDIGDTRTIKTDKIAARDSEGLKLVEDGDKGIFIKDSNGYVGIHTTSPGKPLTVEGATGTPNYPAVRIQHHGAAMVNAIGLIELGALINNVWNRVAYFGLGSPSNNDMIFMNEQDAGLKYYTNGLLEMELKSGGDMDIKNNKIVDPKNHAASALSGTKKVVELDIGGTAYYFEVYPTKA